MKKTNKIFLGTFALFLLGLIVEINTVFGISITNYAPKYAKTTNTVNFRAVASTKKGKLGILAKNTSIKILATVGDFYVVQTKSNEIGLISSKYIKNASTGPTGAKTYTMITKSTKSTTSNTVLRGGPGTNFAKRMTLAKNTKVTVIGYISNWYIIITENGNVGCIRKDLLKSVVTSTNTNTSTSSKATMNNNEQIIFDLINNARQKQGLSPLKARCYFDKTS